MEEDKELSSTQSCFPKLASLIVIECYKLKSLFYVSSPMDFPNLEVLIINRAIELEKLFGCKEGASKNVVSLPSLKTLKTTRCKKLEVIFPLSILRCLPNLESLAIYECDELKQIMEEDKELSSTHPFFPKLASLVVRECHKLKSLFYVSSLTNFPNLEVLIINGATELEKLFGCKKGACKNFFSLPSLKTLETTRCTKLEVIFLSSILRCLPNLERLDIYECDELKQIMEEDKELSSTQPCLPKLASLVVKECHKLKSLFYVSSPTDFSNLKVLSIDGATELEKLFGCKEGAFKNSFSLSSLKTLETSGCTKLEVIFPAFVLRCLPNLELLYIFQCDELKQIMEEDKELSSTQPCFPKLASLIVIECHMLKSLFYVSSPTHFPTWRCLPNLERLDIFVCDELKQIMEEDKELSSTQPCFPKLASLVVEECHKLKNLFYVSSPTDFPNLEVLDHKWSH
ncbi:hypothetical protein Fmac_030465 [Flemingia macrophylla]|uniref:Disease resistance protein At4g27190-like leucine-rich repeats domain-containing protein n=1 Tax=Flemingia macrophylla TaxID=520843 RepID=A0ABD1KZA1_9FABA